MKHSRIQTDMDRAWHSINALGGISSNHPFDQGYVLGIQQALMVIERLGGSDPLVRAADYSTRMEVLPDEPDEETCTSCGLDLVTGDPEQTVCDRCRAEDWGGARDDEADHRHEQARERSWEE